MNRRNALPLMIAPLLATACALAPERRPNLEGGWTFTIDAGQSTLTQGVMILQADGSQYRGTLTTNRGNNVLPIRHLLLRGDEMEMVVESPNGTVTFKGRLRPDAQAFDGIAHYYTGQRFPMSGTRA